MHNSDRFDNDLIPSVEAAQILKVDRATVTRWATSGRLPTAAKAPGRHGARLFRRAVVEALRDGAA